MFLKLKSTVHVPQIELNFPFVFQKFHLNLFQTDAETGEHLSFAELRRRAFTLARELHEVHGVDRGDVVLVFAPNSIHYPVVFLAAALLGASMTGVNPEFTAGECRFIKILKNNQRK